MIEVWSISNLSNARYGATPWQPAPRQRQALKFAPMARRSSTLYVSRRKQELSAVKKTKVRVSHKTLECTRARLALGSFRPLGPALIRNRRLEYQIHGGSKMPLDSLQSLSGYPSFLG